MSATADRHWRVRAACARAEVSDWFVRPARGQAAKAARVCLDECPVLPECAGFVDGLLEAGEVPRTVVLAGVHYGLKGPVVIEDGLKVARSIINQGQTTERT